MVATRRGKASYLEEICLLYGGVVRKGCGWEQEDQVGPLIPGQVGI